ILDDDEDSDNSNSSHRIVEEDNDFVSVTTSRSNMRRNLSTKRSSGKPGKGIERTSSSSPAVIAGQVSTPAACVSVGGDADRKSSPGSALCLHSGVAESSLGLDGGCLSSQTIGQFIQCPTMSRVLLDRAVHVLTSADRALVCDSLYQLGLHFSSVPKCDKVNVQLSLSAPSPKSCERKKRKRILDRSWLDSDCSEDESKIDRDLSATKPEENVTDNRNNLRTENVSSSDPIEMELGSETERCDRTLQDGDQTLLINQKLRGRLKAEHAWPCYPACLSITILCPRSTP
ncbi:hypothetical protein EGW08_009117, partial [Elysia chlorotica]